MRSDWRGARSEERGTRSELVRRAAVACCVALVSCAPAMGASFAFDDIQYWVGSGTNRAAIAIDWSDTSNDPPALVWGFRWSGTAHGSDMLAAVVADDPALFARLGGTRTNPQAVYGLGYDANHNGQFGIDDGTPFDAQGFAFTGPSDLSMATDAGDYYSEGWFAGFWAYGNASSDPYAPGGSWSHSPVGMASRLLNDGAWDSWAFSSSTASVNTFAVNPVAAPSPYPPGDFDHNGIVTTADYQLWRSKFGSTIDPAPDANHDGVVDAGDYVVWRHAMSAGGAGGLASHNVPEPTSVMLTALLLIICMCVNGRSHVHVQSNR